MIDLIEDLWLGNGCAVRRMHLSGVGRWGLRLGLLLEQTCKSLECLVRSAVHLIQGIIGNGVGFSRSPLLPQSFPLVAGWF